ncbi:MAG TPA: hypothetical protein VI282_05645 [Verrucomicrobiae bacterium]
MLSILERELRVASRRRWTFWSRVITSVIAFGAGLFLVMAAGSLPTANGQYLFNALVFVSFWICLIQGVRRAAASISDEKRDGTLGLLFLTDLRTIDIIAGKLSAVAIPLIQPVLAFVPVLAFSVLLGGTTGGEILRAGLTLASILLYSISAGLFVSSVSRGVETGQSTIFLLLANLALPRWLAYGLWNWVRYLSPWSAYANIPDPGYRVSPDEFRYSLLVMNALAALLLTGAGLFLKRRWEDRVIVKTQPARAIAPRRPVEQKKRAAILDRNPGEWLASRHSMGIFSKGVFIILTVVLCLLAAVVSNAFGTGGGSAEGMAVLALAALLLLIRLASQASYPLAEARRSGAIEMLISTPLDPKCLISGQLVSLRNQFIVPFGMLLITSFFIITQAGDVSEFAGIIIGTVVFWGFIALLGATITAFGMWMGLREKSPNAAFFKTIAFTLLPILFGWCFISWFGLPVAYLVLFAISIANITGASLRRLLRNEKPMPEMTPVRIPRSYEVPPVIKR